jgi:hypothetical protein
LALRIHRVLVHATGTTGREDNILCVEHDQTIRVTVEFGFVQCNCAADCVLIGTATARRRAREQSYNLVSVEDRDTFALQSVPQVLAHELGR